MEEEDDDTVDGEDRIVIFRVQKIKCVSLETILPQIISILSNRHDYVTKNKCMLPKG